VMFTSGSTGTPKGVAITHKGVLGLVVEPNYVGVSPSDRVAQVASVSSDITTFEIWAPLLNGASVHILDREILLSPAALAEFLTTEKITILSVTSVLTNHRAYTGPLARSGLHDLHFGAEAGSPEAIRELLDSGFGGTAAHVYGPTETTMLATYATIGDVPGDCARLPVGFPVSATEVYVMDERLRRVPPGLPGELCIAGDRLARGYIGRPGLTAELFCPNTIPGRAGERMYRTGDLARQRPDGQFEILGRMDRQLKIRGFRVEPAEIEAVLTAMPDVAEAAAVARRDCGGGEARLVAYVSPMPGASISVPAVRAALRDQLPGYMVPSAVVELPRLPLTATGKVDERALPPPEEMRPAGAGLTESLGPRERLVADAMCSVLGVDSVGRGDDFFAVGGHSLLAVRLIEELRSAGFEVPMAHLLAHPTVAGMAGWAEHAGSGLPALILVHGGGGGVTAYGPLLAALGDRYRCVLLEARAVRRWKFADLAAHYVEQVYPTLADGTAVLAGWSLGGTIAHEMACIWRDGSGTSLPVLMVDSWPGAPPANGYDPLTAFVYDLAASSGAPMPTLPPAGTEPAEALTAALSQLRDVPGFGRLEVSQLADRFAIFQDLSDAAVGHRPRRYEGPVTLAEAARSRSKAARWARFCSDLTTVVLPGDHHSVLRDAAPGLAALSADLMRQADPPGPA
jgi:thioesterase domain-containing protein/aryl carrier-like protein